jgi:hypothetical protein
MTLTGHRGSFRPLLDVARQAGVGGSAAGVGLDPVYGAVAAMDTITLIRSAARGLLAVVTGHLHRPGRPVACGDHERG